MNVIASQITGTDGLIYSLFRIKTKKTVALCEGNPSGLVDSLHKWPNNAGNVSMPLCQELLNVIYSLRLPWIFPGVPLNGASGNILGIHSYCAMTTESWWPPIGPWRVWLWSWMCNFKHIIVIDFLWNYPWWMPLLFADDKSTLVFEWWLGVVRHEAITWTNFDLVMWEVNTFSRDQSINW